RADELGGTAPSLTDAEALGDVDRLSVGMGVPCGVRAGGEVDARGRNARWLGGRCDRVDIDRAREPVAGSWRRLNGVPGDLHVVLLLCVGRRAAGNYRRSGRGEARHTVE